jgi:hypothetical protein
MTASADLPDLGLPRPEEAYSAFRSFVSQFDSIELLSQAGGTPHGSVCRTSGFGLTENPETGRDQGHRGVVPTNHR